MAVGANHLVAAVVGLGIVVAASLVLWPRRHPSGWHGAESTLSLRVALAAEVRATAEQVLLNDSTSHLDLGRHRAPGDFPRAGLSRPPPAESSPAELGIELNGLEGVENVGLQQGD
jgi:hypothetical protein